MSATPEQVAQGLEALANELLGRKQRMSWDMVGDTAVLVQASGLKLGELGDRLMDAHTLRDQRQAISAMATTNWHCWERLPKPEEHEQWARDYGTRVWDHSTYNRLYYEIDVNGPSTERLSGSRILTVAEFSWSSRWNRDTAVSAFTKRAGPSQFKWHLEWNRDVHPYFEDPPPAAGPDAGWYIAEFRPQAGSWTTALQIYANLQDLISTSLRLVRAGLQVMDASARVEQQARGRREQIVARSREDAPRRRLYRYRVVRRS